MKKSFPLCFVALASLLFAASCEDHDNDNAVSTDNQAMEAESSSAKTKAEMNNKGTESAPTVNSKNSQKDDTVKSGNSTNESSDKQSGQSSSSGADNQNSEQFRFDSSGYSANVGQWSGVTMVLKGGTPPFSWSSDGNCGYLQSTKTTERKNSFVVSQWLSGETSVTVKATDAKGAKASCQLRLIPNVTVQ